MPKIEHNMDECIGCGACANICPDYFEMEGGKSHLKGSKKKGNIFSLEVKDLSCIGEAAEACPVQCIKVIK